MATEKMTVQQFFESLNTDAAPEVEEMIAEAAAEDRIKRAKRVKDLFAKLAINVQACKESTAFQRRMFEKVKTNNQARIKKFEELGSKIAQLDPEAIEKFEELVNEIRIS